MANNRIKVGVRIADPADAREVAGAKRANVETIKTLLELQLEKEGGDLFADGVVVHTVVNMPPAVQARTGKVARVNTTWQKTGGPN